jgi:hypothetical protein
MLSHLFLLRVKLTVLISTALSKLAPSMLARLANANESKPFYALSVTASKALPSPATYVL